jgi:bisphosphoglycerate-independent phosphoglycerate mutase (AlkP superfamily)
MAGRRLALAALPYQIALFEYFQTDRAGHTGERERAEDELRRLDAFLDALLDILCARGRGRGAPVGAARGNTLIALTSDHGNLEDLASRRHTTHPVPLLAWGPGAEELVARTERLSDVTPNLLALLGS